MERFPFLAQRLFNVPLAVHPRKAEIVVAALAERLGMARFRFEARRIDGAELAFDDDDRDFTPRARRGYDLVDGLAVIEVSGLLVHKLGTLRPYSGMTGYDGIRQNFLTAISDPEVRAIVLDIDSPGGEVAGCFDLADTIRAARGMKPVWAILSESAYSAAYAIASAADRVTVPRTGGVGSIGVVVMHVDLSKALDKEGIAITLIQYGAHKTEGNPYEPLAPDVRKRIQGEIDMVGELFVSTVAANRGLSIDTVRATEAAIFRGARGVELGFADAVLSPDAALRALLDQLDRID
jgi:signal peptide peptidase SppA